MKYKIFGYLSLLFIGLSCNTSIEEPVENETTLEIPFEKHTLDNGLRVLFHVDRSDPVVAVALTAHVGSAREKEGRTGFAHLFEHLLFLESENLGKGGLDAMSARIGGAGANGSTNRDVTNYYQTVPKDALEKMIWAEADKLGYFINTVTAPVLAKEKQVVKNEKRQSVDNRPYGHESFVIGKNLYPKDHPYNWQVIGSLEDLQNASLEDVKEFYRSWYTTNNTVLTIAGDFDTEQALAWVKKYFGEIAPGDTVQPLQAPKVELKETKSLYHEDNFAQTPRLRMTWPTIKKFEDETYALDILAAFLTDGKKAPLNAIVVEQDQVADRAYAFHNTSELAGEFGIIARAYRDTDLDSVKASVASALKMMDQQGMTQADLERIKAARETRFYQGLSGVLGKGFQLTQYEILAGDAAYLKEDMKKLQAVSIEDVNQAYQTYIKDQPFIITSFVPKNQLDLAVEGAEKAEVVEESIVAGAEEQFDASISADYPKTPSSFDRSQEPPYGPMPSLKIPEVYKENLSSGIQVLGINDNEVPLVQMEWSIPGGALLEDNDQRGVAHLMAELMNKGTQTKTPLELENSINQLGANINISSDERGILIEASMLSRHFDAVSDLIEEMILEPRWDQAEFDLIKQQTLGNILQLQANPRAIATQEFEQILYGEQHPLAQNKLGTETTVNQIELADVKQFYQQFWSPHMASLKVVGDIDKDAVLASVESLNERWAPKDFSMPELAAAQPVEQSRVYFYDVPNAKQSILYFGHASVPATHPDFYKLQVLNYRLGGGGFASQLTQELREAKGYTYGIRSRFEGTPLTGRFYVNSGVRSNVTYESTQLIHDILTNYAATFNQEDLEVTKSYMLKSSARAFESPSAKLRMLSNIAENDWPVDYAKQRQDLVEGLSLEQVKALGDEYVRPEKMIYVIVGDAKTQLDGLSRLGMGEIIRLN